MNPLGHRASMAVACASFLVLGVFNATLGPALPELAAQTGTDLTAVGGVFTALFFGGLLSQGVAGPLSDRFGQRPVLAVGFVLLILGLGGLLASHNLVLILACIVVAGLGYGTVCICITVLVAELFSGRGAAALNLINMFFGVGAVAGPALASLTLARWGSALVPFGLAIGLFALLLPLGWRLAARPPTRAPAAATPAPAATSLLATPLLWVLGALLLLYVGTETGLSGWTSVYLQHSTALDAAHAAQAASGFWLAITLGRLGGSLLGTRMAPSLLLQGCLVGALGGVALLMIGVGNLALSLAAVLLLGLCFGPVYPTALAITNATFRRAPSTATSVVSCMGSLGGMLLPWLQGLLLTRTGPAASVVLVAGSTLAMLAAFSLARSLSRQGAVFQQPARAEQ